MRFLGIISGRSGSGKTVALRVLEDLGFYCIDNLPVSFLPGLVNIAPERYPRLAVSIDIRNMGQNSSGFASMYKDLKDRSDIDLILLYTDADDQVLIKRYSETRRLHPLSRRNLSLSEAIVLESKLMAPIAAAADLRIDTSSLSVHELASAVTTLICGRPEKQLVIVFESFGFKNGIAKDADFVFDARFLPNPFWEKPLRHLTGLDQPVKDFFARYPQVDHFVKQIDDLLMSNLHDIQKSNRSYLTVAIGCTGGCHRSVYIAQKLCDNFTARGLKTQIRHRSLEAMRKAAG